MKISTFLLLLSFLFSFHYSYADSMEISKADLLTHVKSGKTYSCSSLTLLNEGKMNGDINDKIFFANGNLYIESNMVLAAPTKINLTNYTITDGTYLYGWQKIEGDNKSVGMKINLNSQDARYSLEQSIQSLSSSTFKCVSTVADMSKFTPPSYVQFKLKENKIRNVAIVQSISVKKPNFVVSGRYLTKVEIRYGLKKYDSISSSILLGNTTLQNTSDSGVQTWLFPIPREKGKALDILAVGYENEKIVSGVFLPEDAFNTAWE